MSLQFRAGVLLMLVSLSLACAGKTSQNGTIPTAATAPLADLISDTRSLDQPSNAARVDALQSLLKRRGLDFSLQPFPNSARQRDSRERGQNIVLDPIGGDGPQIIVGAHFDAVSLPGGGHSRGMVDNGAAVVVLTRVAEALRGQRLRHRVQVVFFDMEESGLLGSAFMAKSLDRAKVRAMVNIDIAGYGDTIMSGPMAPAGSTPLHQALSRVCADRGYNCIRLPAFPPSDDRSFQAAGISAISVAVLPAIEAHQVWLLLNGGKESGLAPGFAPAVLRTIHTAEDTADRLSAEGMTLIYNAVLGLILELDAG
jgi:hypothetical protein